MSTSSSAQTVLFTLGIAKTFINGLKPTTLEKVHGTPGQIDL
jgi:hypothetical protein